MAVETNKINAPNPSEDRRAKLSEAYDKAVGEAEDAPDEVEPSTEASPEEVAAAKADQPGAKEAPDEVTEPEDKGKEKSEPEAKEKPEGKEPPEKLKPAGKPPGSWNAAAREKWATIAPEAQKEILRREQQIVQTLNQAANRVQQADARVKQADAITGQLQQVVGPYAAMIASQGSTPIKAIQSLLKTSYSLQYGNEGQKAQLVSDIMHGYGISVDALVAALEKKGGAPQARQQAQHFSDPRVDQLLSQFQQEKQERQRVEQSRQQQILSQGSAALEEWTSSGDREFLEDVRDEMADIMERAAGRGVHMDFDEAYRRACLLDPSISEIVGKRADAEKVKAKAEAAKKAKAASVSVRSNPGSASPSGKQQATSRREALTAAWDQAESAGTR